MDTIEVQIQKFSYGNVQVLKQIQFTVPEGTFCVLLGQNGAGKSTLLKLMLGEISLDEQGAIRLFGQNVCHSFIAGQRLAMYLREEWRHIRIFLHQ